MTEQLPTPEYVIWGKATPDGEDQVIYTKAKNEEDAGLWCEYFKKKQMAYDMRIQVIDFQDVNLFGDVLNI